MKEAPEIFEKEKGKIEVWFMSDVDSLPILTWNRIGHTSLFFHSIPGSEKVSFSAVIWMINHRGK